MAPSSPAPADTLLTHRSAPVVARLGSERPVPLLDARASLPLRGEAGALVCVPFLARELVPALLRAARDERASLGIVALHRPDGPRTMPPWLFDSVADSASSPSHRQPLFLQIGPLVARADRPLEALAQDAFRWLDAGFTLLSLDATGLDAGQQAEAYLALAEPAREPDVPVEISFRPRDEPEAALESLLQTLAGGGLVPATVRLLSGDFLPEGVGSEAVEPDFGRVAALDEVAARFGTRLALSVRGIGLRDLPSWVAAGIAKLEVGDPFARIVHRGLPERIRGALDERVTKGTTTLAEMLGHLGDPLDAASVASRERVEALAYMEAVELLRAVGATGSGARVRARLERDPEP